MNTIGREIAALKRISEKDKVEKPKKQLLARCPYCLEITELNETNGRLIAHGYIPFGKTTKRRCLEGESKVPERKITTCHVCELKAFYTSFPEELLLPHNNRYGGRCEGTWQPIV